MIGLSIILLAEMQDIFNNGSDCYPITQNSVLFQFIVVSLCWNRLYSRAKPRSHRNKEGVPKWTPSLSSLPSKVAVN